MVSKYVICPVCDEKAALQLTGKEIDKAERFPVTIKIEHEDHYFYINLDSNGSVTDILSPELVE